ncbi:MAG: ribosomal protein S18-alanine N-acetyltransferase [Burkholderiaceae bacterium]|nr:ribosomal protein S18-alanine N-acetyltransferase [Burkholderiaceae bacterium]
MSALLQFNAASAPQREPMTVADLDAVLGIENLVYEFPWTRGNFIDSLAAGYAAQVLRRADGELCAYCVTMTGVQEMHLLNLSVAPAWQHRGLGRGLLDALAADCRAADALWLWLEVRESNRRAREIYRQYGFEQVGWRRSYYPAVAGRREDACVLRLPTGGSRDALD